MKKIFTNALATSLLAIFLFGSLAFFSGCANQSKSYDRGYGSRQYSQPYSASEGYRPYRPAPRDPKSF